jgi:protein-tyrosine phosphatase
MRIPIDDSLKDIDINKLYEFASSDIEFIHKHAGIQKQNIFIHCYAGRQRSAACIALYLMGKHNLDCLLTLKILLKNITKIYKKINVNKPI